MKASLLIIEESGCEGKTEGVLEKVTLAKHFTLKSLEILYNVGSTKNAMLKVWRPLIFQYHQPSGTCPVEGWGEVSGKL